MKNVNRISGLLLLMVALLVGGCKEIDWELHILACGEDAFPLRSLTLNMEVGGEATLDGETLMDASTVDDIGSGLTEWTIKSEDVGLSTEGGSHDMYLVPIRRWRVRMDNGPTSNEGGDTFVLTTDELGYVDFYNDVNVVAWEDGYEITREYATYSPEMVCEKEEEKGEQ